MSRATKVQRLGVPAEAPVRVERPSAEELQELIEEGKIIAPQPGPQEAFLASPADIVIFGGAAGSSKTYGLLLDPLRFVHNPKYNMVFFRRTHPEITNEGGLWDTSTEIYPRAGLEPRPGNLEWFRPGGGTVRMTHLVHEKTKHNFQGSQICGIAFDELTHFSQTQFWYMLSRNRSTCGIRPYVRASTNPDADSWVAEFIAWWIDQETGYPIPERSGVIRYFIRDRGELFWADTREELVEKFTQKYKEDAIRRKLKRVRKPYPKSVTFISATVDDNKVLLEKNPEYVGNLEALPPVERERLLAGNWKIRAEAGKIVDRSWFKSFFNVLPDDIEYVVRGWDNAATEDGGDWSAGIKIGRRTNGRFIIMDVIREQWHTHQREQAMKATRDLDTEYVVQAIEQEPGSSGLDMVRKTVLLLAGSNVEVLNHTGSKVTRALPFASAAQAGLIDILVAPWNEPWLAEWHAFPTKNVPDDQVDATTNAFKVLTTPNDWKLIPFNLVFSRR